MWLQHSDTPDPEEPAMPLWKLHGDGRTVAPGAVVRPR